MHIRDTVKCNRMNLAQVERYAGLPEGTLQAHYEELRGDGEFLAALNGRMAEARHTWNFRKGIFRKPRLASIDWFAFERVLIYVLIRHFRPAHVLETGVFYGGNTTFALAALARNGAGRLVSIDYPDSSIRASGGSEDRHALVGESELYDPALKPGFLVPEALHAHWELVLGDSLVEIPRRSERFGFYIHDSDHSMGFLSRELQATQPKLTPDALILVDDIDWSNAFFAYCVQERLHPLLLTDNGKDDLRVRTGIALRAHPRNGDPAYT